jgi:hypothetical protein
LCRQKKLETLKFVKVDSNFKDLGLHPAATLWVKKIEVVGNNPNIEGLRSQLVQLEELLEDAPGTFDCPQP